MASFFLFRLKIEKLSHGELFADSTLLNQDVILAAIEKKSSYAPQAGQEWRIGDIERLPDSSVFIALGKITQSTRRFYDTEKGNFDEEEFEDAPRTHVLVDLNFQIFAIAKRPVSHEQLPDLRTT